MIAALSSVTTLQATFAEDVNACADAGCSALEVWLTKFEDYLQGSGAWARPEAVHKLLADRQVKLVGSAYQGGILFSQGDAHRVQLDQFQRRLQLCQEFGIGVLIVAPDPVPGFKPEHVHAVLADLAQMAELASAFEVRLALEFRSSTAWCACLPTAAALVQSVGSRYLGLCLDLFHYYTGPSKFEDLALLSPDNLFAVQLCDLAGVAREMAADGDRILPGEGDFLLKPIVTHLQHIDYRGYVSVELMNPELWKMKPVQVAEAAYTALRIQLGQAGMTPTLQQVGG
jgi:2-keto-myo-inositol isomerase